MRSLGHGHIFRPQDLSTTTTTPRYARQTLSDSSSEDWAAFRAFVVGVYGGVVQKIGMMIGMIMSIKSPSPPEASVPQVSVGQSNFERKSCMTPGTFPPGIPIILGKVLPSSKTNTESGQGPLLDYSPFRP